MSKTQKILSIIGLILVIITFCWLSSFLFRLFMSGGDVGFLKSLIKGNFALNENVRSMPFDILYYHWNYKEIYPKEIKFAWMTSGFIHGMILLIIVKITAKKPKLYGDARFAKVKEIEEAGLFIPHKDIKKTGLFAGNQIIVGRLGNRYIGLGGQQFVYLAAPTRSGKGVGVVIPVGLSYDHSMVVLDIKQELFELTAAYRAKCGQEVYLFNPFDIKGRTSCWNPLPMSRAMRCNGCRTSNRLPSV